MNNTSEHWIEVYLLLFLFSVFSFYLFIPHFVVDFVHQHISNQPKIIPAQRPIKCEIKVRAATIGRNIYLELETICGKSEKQIETGR